jgi:hypothetical protein
MDGASGWHQAQAQTSNDKIQTHFATLMMTASGGCASDEKRKYEQGFIECLQKRA